MDNRNSENQEYKIFESLNKQEALILSLQNSRILKKTACMLILFHIFSFIAF